jgi:hypothetical protein
MIEHESTFSDPPPRPRFQFSLRTLLLLCVVLGASMGVLGAWGVLAFGIVVGLAFHIHYSRSFTLPVYPDLAVLCLFGSFFWWCVSAYSDVHELGRLAACGNNMKQIAMALQKYHDANGRFPPAYIADATGKPMHSWRVLILPYTDWDGLYKTYKLGEPWNGPNNIKLSNCTVPLYWCISDRTPIRSGLWRTNYVAVVGPNAAWSGDKARKLNDLGGKAADTIMVIEVANSGIAWSEPKDLSLSALEVTGTNASTLVPSSKHGPHSNFFCTYGDALGAYAAMADGSVRYLPPDCLSAERLPDLLQIGGCKGDGIESLDNSYHHPHIRPNWPNIAALAVWILSVGILFGVVTRRRRRPSAEIPTAAQG